MKICILGIFSFILLFSLTFNSSVSSQPTNTTQLELINSNMLQGERIFFIKKRIVSNMVLGDIYSMNSSGGDVKRLTNLSDSYAITGLPEISSDGTKLSFISNFESWKSANYIDAFLADLPTGSIKRITGHEKTTPVQSTGTVNVTVNDPLGVALTPSAIRISYKGCTNFVTGNSATLTVPAGEEIWIKAEVAKAKGDIKIITVPVGGNKSVNLDLSNGTLSAESCSPSFNGNYLAVSENSEAISNSQGETFSWYKIRIWDTSKKNEIVEVGGFKQGADITPAYSPNDNFLALCTGEQAIQSLGIVPTSNITSTPTLIAYGNIFGYQAYCTSPAWSPDGEEIAYVYVILTTSFYGLEIESNIYKVSINGGEPVKVTNYSGKVVASKPSFSPDGSKIAFTRSVSNNNVFTLSDYINGSYSSDIYYTPENGGDAVSLTSDGVSVDPAWGIVNTPVDVNDNKYELTEEFSLFQNYPNPFNPTTTIKYSIPSNVKSEMSNVETFIRLIVYDIRGREVAALVNKIQKPGEYSVQFDASNLSSGIYYYQLKAGNIVKTNKMILLK